MCEYHSTIQCIVPPYVLDALGRCHDPRARQLASQAAVADAESRTLRATLATLPIMAAIPSPGGRKHRLVYDMRGGPLYRLPGRLTRSEGDSRSTDPAVNEAYDGSGAVYDFYAKLFERNSLDDRGMSLISSVHVGRDYNNAFWNGEQMAYGDGDGRIFLRFTRSLDVIGHELTHGVVAHTSNLEYRDQPGALNEHFADVFGSLVRQWKAKQTTAKASWLIGQDIMGPAVRAKALRTLKREAAYRDDPYLGTDPQPKHMRDLYRGTADNGGVHINSGIPNHAFYLAATAIGGYAWEKAGRVWYDAMLALGRSSEFVDAARATYSAAGERYGSKGGVRSAVKAAWKQVGIGI